MKRIRLGWICIGVVVLAIVAFLLFLQVRSYSSYDVIQSLRHTDAQSTRYVAFGNRFVKYGSDGITCVDSDGNTVWNQSYEMDEPLLSVGDDYIAVGEWGGRQIYVLDKDGLAGKMETGSEILQVSVSEKGTVAAVCVNDGVYYLCVYGKDGTQIAQGTIRMENSGYPMSIAISEDGTTLAVGFLSLSAGKVDSTLAFYNFSSVGQNEIDNLVGTFAFEDTMIAKVAFITDTTLVVYTDGGIYVYNGTKQPELVNEIVPEEEPESIFYGNHVFGTVTRNSISVATASGNAEGTAAYQMTLYSTKGKEIFSEGLDINYKKVQVLANGQIAVYGDHDLVIFTHFGIEKFAYTFEDTILCVRNVGILPIYEIVFEDHTDRIRLL